MRWGLLLFFVLSGFLLYRPWLAATAGADPPDLRRYLRSRAARVLPAYYVALAGACLLLAGSASVPGVRLPAGESWSLFVVFAENFSPSSVLTLDPPMWTLAVEISFYAALPLIGLLAIRLGRRRQLLLPAALIAMGMIWNWVVGLSGGALPLTKVLPAMLPFFAIGMIAATLFERKPLEPRGARRLGLLAVTALGVQAVFEWLMPGAASVLHDLPVAVAFAAVVAIAASAHCPRLLRWRPLTATGTISYGLYLWHVPVLWWLRARGLLPLDPLAAAPIVIVPSVLIASLSWIWIERPGIAWAKRRSRATSVTTPERGKRAVSSGLNSQPASAA